MNTVESDLLYAFAIRSDHPCLAGHFPGSPIVPGVVMLDQVLRGLRTHAGYALSNIAYVKFKSMLLPDERAEVRYVFHADKCSFTLSTVRQDMSVVLASGVIGGGTTAQPVAQTIGQPADCP